jgi:membrane protease YdiL (CAAX protease family)
VVATLILLPIVLVLQRLFGSAVAVVAAALLWALAHSLQAAAWGLVVWWPFLIMSIALLAWRGRGLGRALGVVIAIHALQNAAAAALLFAGPR